MKNKPGRGGIHPLIPVLSLGLPSFCSGLLLFFHGQIKTALFFFILGAIFYIRFSLSLTHSKKGWLKKISLFSYSRKDFIPLAIAAGYYGSLLISFPNLHWGAGLPLMALSAFFLWKGFPAAPPRIKKNLPLPQFADHAPSLTWFFFVTPPLWVGMYLFFYSNKFLMGLGCLAVTSILLSAFRKANPEPRIKLKWPSEAKWLLGILVAAALLRYPFFRDFFAGFQSDEGMDALSARDALQGKVASPFYTYWGGSPSLPYFLNGLACRLFGFKLATLRTVSMTCSMLATLVFYRWIRLYWSPRACLPAAFLFAISWWHLFFAFSTFTPIFTLLFELCAFYFLERAFQGVKKIDFWWAGLFSALTVMTYLPGRFVPFMALGFILGCVFFTGGRSFWKINRGFLFFYFLVFLWALSPFLHFIFRDPRLFLERMGNLTILQTVIPTRDFWLPVKTVFFSFLSFFWTTDHGDERFMVPFNPILDYFTGFLLLAGFILTLKAIKQRSSWAALSGTVFGVAANAFAIQKPNPDIDYVNAMRMFYVFPFLMLMAARALEWFWGIFDKSSPSLKKAGWVLLAAGLSIALIFNINIYFFRFSQQPGNWSLLGFQQMEQAKYNSALKTSCHLIATPSSYSSIIDFFSGVEPDDVTIIDENVSLPILRQAKRDVAFMLPADFFERYKERFKQSYPNALLIKVRDRWGSHYLTILRIPKADFQTAQRGSRLEPPLH